MTLLYELINGFKGSRFAVDGVKRINRHCYRIYEGNVSFELQEVKKIQVEENCLCPNGNHVVNEK